MSDDAESRARAMSEPPWGWDWEEYPPVTPGRPFDLAAMLNVEFLPAGFWINPADMAISMGMRFAAPAWLAERIDKHPEGTSKGGQIVVNAMHLRGQLVTAVARAHRNGDEDAADAWAACNEYDRQSTRLAALLATETERLRAEGRVIDATEEYIPPPGSPLPDAHLSQLAADTRCFRALANWYTARTGVKPFTPSQKPEKPRKRTPRPRTTALPDVFRWKNDNINRLAVEAIAHATDMQPHDGLAYGYPAAAEHLRITFGVPAGPSADTLWECLCQRGAAVVKMHFALWARWYERPDQQSPWVFLNITQACQDAGYTRHHKGGFKPRDKRALWAVLDALTAVQVRGVYAPPHLKAKGKEAVIPGSLWMRDMNARLQDQYADLYGHAREGDPETWEPITFAYQPGAWFYHADWEPRNRFVGRASTGLMRLSARCDEWAILMGGYLITQARTGRYARRAITAGVILKRANLGQGKDDARRKKQYQGKFTAALDRLAEVGVIAGWEWANGETADIEDWDDPDAIADYYGDDVPLPPGDWRAQKVIITWPPELEAKGQAMEAKRQKAITRTKRRGGKTTKHADEG